MTSSAEQMEIDRLRLMNSSAGRREQERRGLEQNKLAMMLARNNSVLTSAFDDEDYTYLPMIIVARVAKVDEDGMALEAVEFVGPSGAPASLAAVALGQIYTRVHEQAAIEENEALENGGDSRPD